MIHKDLSQRWVNFSLAMQMGNIGSEFSRIFSWRGKNMERAEASAERAIELIDMTLSDKRRKSQAKELLFLREMISDLTWGNNEFDLTPETLAGYFAAFGKLAIKN